MSRVDVLIEVKQTVPEAFSMHEAALSSESESTRQAEDLVERLSGVGLEVQEGFAPVPMFSQRMIFDRAEGLAAFDTPVANADVASTSVVVSAEVDKSELEKLKEKPNIKVWPNSPLTLYGRCSTCGQALEHPFDLARSSATGIDCAPHLPAVSLSDIRQLLGVQRVWDDGFRGQNVVVGILDEGVNGQVYPVIGGFSRPDAQRPGTASIQSHGSMCAADVLVAAPGARLLDYPFLGVPNSGGALAMFQAVLDQRRIDGTPHLTTNSYGFMSKPPQSSFPDHEVWDIQHPMNRKVREVVASGCPCFFSAGNCGANCPDGRCRPSGIGPGNSIHGANSLPEVISVAAVNHRHERIGYSSQGPGGFEPQKPDLAGYSHFHGNFGPGRPAGGTSDNFDSGTSAACPVVAGIGALIRSAFDNLTPSDLKAALIRGTANLGSPGWDADTGFGIINAAATYMLLSR